MRSIENLFYELIRIAIGAQNCFTRMPMAHEWSMLYRIAKKQSLLGICFVALHKLGANADDGFARIGIPKEIYFQWMGMAVKIQQRNEKVNQQCVELQDRLSADGFKSCLLKGQGVAQFYTSHSSIVGQSGSSQFVYDLRQFRQPGDIDLWVNSDMDTVLDYVFSRKPSKVFDMKHIHFDFFDDTEVELHWIPSVSAIPSRNRRLRHFYNSHSEVFDNSLFIDSERKIVAASPRFNAVYLLQHIQGHFLYEGIGLRQLMDYYFTLIHLDENDRIEVMDDIKYLGLKKILSAVMYVMQTVFGIEKMYLLCEPSIESGNELLKEIMMGGNFGHYSKENRVKNESVTHWAWKRLKRRVRLIQYDSMSIVFRPIYRIKVSLVKSLVIRRYGI